MELVLVAIIVSSPAAVMYFAWKIVRESGKGGDNANK